MASPPPAAPAAPAPPAAAPAAPPFFAAAHADFVASLEARGRDSVEYAASEYLRASGVYWGLCAKSPVWCVRVGVSPSKEVPSRCSMRVGQQTPVSIWRLLRS
jgi:hypothetical protein